VLMGSIVKLHVVPNRLAIEKGIPYPAKAERIVDRFQFADLDLGDSFLVPYPPSSNKLQHRRIQMGCGAVIADAHRKLPSRRFSQRSENHGVRIWRIV
jgi:hypothetical protein